MPLLQGGALDSAPKQPLQDRLAVHTRLRVMGAIERGEVDVGPLLGRGSYGRVYKGAPACYCGVHIAAIECHAILAGVLGAHPSFGGLRRRTSF